MTHFYHGYVSPNPEKGGRSCVTDLSCLLGMTSRRQSLVPIEQSLFSASSYPIYFLLLTEDFALLFFLVALLLSFSCLSLLKHIITAIWVFRLQTRNESYLSKISEQDRVEPVSQDSIT